MKQFVRIKKKKNITEYQLTKNGMSVLYINVPDTPTVTTNIIYHIGSKDENVGETGISHMLEHMLFKKTKNYKTIKSWKDIEDKGALMNATTWNDRTHYFFTLPKEYLSDMLETEAERMRNLLIEEKEFLPEQTNVLSEFEMSYGSQPSEILSTAVSNVAFTAHGYGHGTIGYKNDIKNYTVEKLKKFYNTYYWPNNATLVIVGDLPEKIFLKEVYTHFGKIEKSPSPIPSLDNTEPKQEGRRYTEIRQNSPLQILEMAFKVPSVTHSDWVPLLIICNYLTTGPLSTLYKKLIEGKKATSVSANLFPTKDPYLATITTTLAENITHESVLEIIKNEIGEIQKNEIPKIKLTELQNMLETEILLERDGTFNIAYEMTEYVAAGDWARYFSILEDVKKVTPKKLKEVSNKYFIESQMTVGSFIGK